MKKGDETSNGVYLGEQWTQRGSRLTKDQAVEHVSAYIELGHDISDDESSVNKFQDYAIAFVFDNDGEQVVILAEDFYPQL